MPEGPEVKRLVDQLSPVVSGKEILGIKIHSGRYLKKDPEGYFEFKSLLPAKIIDVYCYGKFIYFRLSNDWSIWNTLGMTGGWTGNNSHSHMRLSVRLSDCSVFYNDTRNFGTFKFVKGEDALNKKLSSLGSDPLKGDISPYDFRSRLMYNPHRTLAEILTDQGLFAGVGNYIKAEVLYVSRLSPHRTAQSLSEEEILNLNNAVNSIPKASYNSGGSTIKTYSDFFGNSGNFSGRFLVYGQKKDPFGNPVVKEQTKDKRTTHWVPEIQK